MAKQTSPLSLPPPLLSRLLHDLLGCVYDQKAQRVDDVPVVALECLCGALDILGRALELAPPNLPIRQFLTDIFAVLPTYGTDQSLFQLRQRAAHTIKWSSEDLLGEHCGKRAHFFINMAASLKQSLVLAQERATRARSPRPTLRPDSPRSIPTLPVPFRFGRRTYPFPRMQSFLLDYLNSAFLDAKSLQTAALDGEEIDSEAIENQGAVSVGELYDAIGERYTTSGSLRKLQYDTNANLLKYKIPLKIVRPIPGYLLLKRLPRLTNP